MGAILEAAFGYVRKAVELLGVGNFPRRPARQLQ
jgi:hypothetical protein